MGRLKKKPETSLPLWMQTGHSKPISRRDLLASGVLGFSAALLAPRWLDLLLPNAQAQSALNCATQTSSMIPLITLNLSGGAAMAANFLPMDQGGQPLASYDVMGLGDGQVPIETEFGGVPFAGRVNDVLISKFLEGMRATAPTALLNTSFVGVCARSRDDSGENRFSIDGLVNKAGLSGSLLPNLGRRNGSLTGTNQMAAVVSPQAPLIVGRLSNISGALGYAGALGNTLNQNQKALLAKTMNNLTESQTRKLASRPSKEAVKTLLQCANLKNQQLSNLASTGVDPRQDTLSAAINAVWGINNNTGDNNRELVFASMTYNALKGNAGAASLELGGYDYHNNTRDTGDAADLTAGRVVGQILQTASVMGKPVFVYVTSDGAVSSPKSNDRNAPWSSDRGIAGASYMLYFDPAGRRQTAGHQVGFFTQGQAASESTVVGNNPEMAAIAVFANYLKLNNKMDVFENIVGRAFDVSMLNQVVKF